LTVLWSLDSFERKQGQWKASYDNGYLTSKEGAEKMIFDVLNQFVIDFINSTGYLGLFFAMFIEGIITPIPSEAIVPFAGYLASIGQLNIVLVILIASVGATCGSTVSYGLARLLGRPFVLRFGKYIGINENSIKKADKWFAKYGKWGALFGPMLPGVRSIISYPAGLTKMDLRKYLPSFFIGALVWNTVLTLIGYNLGASWISFCKSMEGLDLVIIATLAIGILSYLVYRRYHRKDSPIESETDCAE
jgi:membrane protein DedA with SNARE-associated domain